MTQVNVDLPSGLNDDVERYVEEVSQHQNKSELMRDAIRRYLEDHSVRLTQETRAAIEKGRRDFEEDRYVSLDDYEDGERSY